MRYEISEQANGIALRTQNKFRIGGVPPVEKTPHITLVPLGDDNFAYEQPAEVAATALLAPTEIRFRNFDVAGHPQYLVSSGRLYRRTQ